MTRLIIQRGMNKQAAAEDGPSLEQQFGILANAEVTTKYPKLDRMKLAFQLIENDEENQRAVGAVVYLVGEEVIFVPAFYRAGKINTGDMMFLAKSQQFLPMSDPWLAWIQNKGIQSSGEVVDRAAAGPNGGAAGAATVRDIADPIIKTATLYLRALARTGTDLTKNAAEHSLLDMVAGMGKKASGALLDKFVKDPEFLNASLRFYSADQIDAFAKKAAELNEPEPEPVQVILPFTKEAKELNPEEIEALNRDGYVIKTNIEAKNLPTVIRKNKIKDMLKVVNDVGKMDLALVDGSVKECLVLYAAGDIESGINCPEDVCSPPPPRKVQNMPADMFIHIHRNTPGASAAFVALTDVSVEAPQELPQDALAISNGQDPFKADMLSSYGKTLDPAEVKWISTDAYILCPDGGCYRSWSKWESDGKGWTCWNNRVLSIAEDPGQTSPIVYGRTVVVPQGSRIIQPPLDDKGYRKRKEIDGEGDAKPVAVATWSNVEYFINSYAKKNYQTMKVSSNGSEAYIDDNGKALSFKEASVKLARKYGIEPAVVRTIMSEVTSGRPGEPKSATYLVSKTAAFNDPDWQNSEDAIGMDNFVNKPPIRDYMEMPSGSVENPAMLEKAVTQAAEQGIKDVFDVTAFKLLVHQNRFLEEIHEDLPTYMKVLDSLCRKLFLLYWHTDKFADSYGTVKLKALEESLKNSIDTLSELTIFFKLRTTDVDTGIGQDGGDLMRGHDL